MVYDGLQIDKGIFSNIIILMLLFIHLIIVFKFR